MIKVLKVAFIVFIFQACISKLSNNYENQKLEQDYITVISNVNIFNGIEYIESTNLFFRKDTIIGIYKDPLTFDATSHIDGKGKTIIPPLVNAHVHISSEADLKESLRLGVFANLDMHTTDEWANMLRSLNDSFYYSRFYSSNAGATVPNGHGTQFGIKVPTINDSVNEDKFVRDRVRANADYIKILREPLMPTLSFDQTLKIIQKAQEHNLMTIAHITRLNDAVRLAGQNVDGLAHIWIDERSDENMLLSLKDNNVFIIPTLYVTKKFLEFGEGTEWIKYVLSLEEILEEVKKAYENGILILCGTDAPNFQINFSSDIFEEMILLSKAGLSNEDVLKSATTNVYNAFSLKDFDIIGKGARANFIVINGNPIKQIEDIRNVEKVFKHGIEILSSY